MMDLSGAVLEHANRGVRLQLLLRGALVVFLLLTIVLIPPPHGIGVYYAIAAVYAIGALAFARWAWPGGAAVARWGWLILSDRGEAGRAEELLRRALVIQERYFGPRHPSLTFTLNGLARL